MSLSRLHPTLYMRLEGAAILALSVLAYARLLGEPSWSVFAAAFLLPDIAMLGYLVNRSLGALCYNVAHSEALPAALLALAMFWAQPWLLPAGLIWFAHIGFDRMLGYGLKHVEDFGHTHLGFIGRQRKHP